MGHVVLIGHLLLEFFPEGIVLCFSSSHGLLHLISSSAFTSRLINSSIEDILSLPHCNLELLDSLLKGSDFFNECFSLGLLASKFALGFIECLITTVVLLGIECINDDLQFGVSSLCFSKSCGSLLILLGLSLNDSIRFGSFKLSS